MKIVMRKSDKYMLFCLVEELLCPRREASYDDQMNEYYPWRGIPSLPSIIAWSLGIGQMNKE